MNTQRRTFLICAAGATAMSSALAQKAGAELVKESDPTAVAIGYSSDGTKTDVKKYPQYKAGQSCSGCTLFTGAAGDVSAPCPIFGNKAVLAKGWCSAWAKKA